MKSALISIYEVLGFVMAFSNTAIVDSSLSSSPYSLKCSSDVFQNVSINNQTHSR